MYDRWQKCRHAAEGEHAVHAEGAKYLPMLKEEQADAYALRLMMTPFFNATWRTIVGLKGMIFRKAPTSNLPSLLTEAAKDIDLAGTTLLGMAQEVVEEALTVGRVGLMVDFPATEPGLTLADLKNRGLRTLMSLYKAESVYNWKESRVNGITTLTQVRMEETFCLNDDEFEPASEKRWRILDLFEGKYRQRVYRLNEKGEEVQVGGDIYPLMNNEPMNYIPFVFIGVDCVGPDVDTPPLIDLVTTNFHHYLQATSYERGCFFSGLPTMFVYGVSAKDTTISIGGSLANVLASPEAKAEYVEVASKFEALRTNLEDKKKEMAVLGARMLEGGKSGGQTEAAETVARRQSGEESVLSSMAQSVSQGLERALQWFAAWEGATGNVVYQLNRDFLPMTMTPGEISALMAAWQGGGISQETLFENLKQGEVIRDDKTFEEEQDLIANGQLNFAQMQAFMNEQLNPP